MNQYTITVEESYLFVALAQYLKQLTDFDSPTAGTDNITYQTINPTQLEKEE